jgi:uncharacterized repeat protein (TIGR01451 family)
MKTKHWIRLLTGLFIGVLGALSLIHAIPSSTEPLVHATFPSPVPETTADPTPPPSIPIRLVRATFDPLVTQPDLPEGLTLQTYPAQRSGLYLVQFYGPIQKAWKTKLDRMGIQLFDYIPDYAFLAWMNEAEAAEAARLPHVRWVGIYQPGYRLNPRLDNAIASAAGTQLLTVVTLPTVDEEAFRAQVKTLGASVRNASVNPFNGYFYLDIDAAQIPALLHLPQVVWVEAYTPMELLNDVARSEGIMNVAPIWHDLGLYGEGQIVGISDSGLDVGTNDEAMNDDFEGRIVQIHNVGLFALDGPEDVCSGHGTHVAGSLLGNGVNSGSNPAAHNYVDSYAGIAPEAHLTFQALEVALSPPLTCPLLGTLMLDLNDLFQQAYNDGARIHSNSWGGEVWGEYTAQSQQADQFAWAHKDFILVFGAGNSGTDADGDGVVDLDAIYAPGTAKNCVTVGASENNRPVPDPNPESLRYGEGWPDQFSTQPISDDLSADNPDGMGAFSSRGPCDDGRLKPDVTAPGTWILSTYSQANHPEDTDRPYAEPQYDGWGEPPNRWYKYMGGTSMATPLAAGATVLVREYYNDIAGLPAPSAALLKATLINGAYDMTPGQYGTGAYQEITGRPDYAQGWGRIDLVNTLMPAPPRTWWFDDHTDGLSTGDVVTYTTLLTRPLWATDDAEPLRVSLVWTDYPGTPSAGGLVNDLDLEVIGPDGTHYYGNGVAWDRVNNVEGVDILTPTLGTYTVVVRAHNIAQETQPYALVVSGALSDPRCQGLTAVTLSAPAQASVGRSARFTAATAPPTATQPIQYTWDFGDGVRSHSTISEATHVYTMPGLYTTVVTATNCGGGHSVTDSAQVNVQCTALSGVALQANNPVEARQHAAFTATVTPPEASHPVLYTWAFGDGISESGTLSTTAHVYAHIGTYTASVTATNCSRTQFFTDTISVTVACIHLTDVAIRAEAPVLTGDPVYFQATTTPPGAGTPISYTWDFGGAGSGSGIEGPSPVFTYTSAGTYTVIVTATNCEERAVVTDTIHVSVEDICHSVQSVTATADDPVKLGEPIHFQATIAPPTSTRPIHYTWNFGAAGYGRGLNTATPVFTYTEAGTHSVAVSALNCDSAHAADSVQVTVEALVNYPDLRIAKTVKPALASPGEKITYTLTFLNLGTAPARDVIISDHLPAGFTAHTVVSQGLVITTTKTGAVYTWRVQDIAPGDGGKIILGGQLAEPLAAGALINTATITTTSTDDNPQNNTATAEVTVRNIPPVAQPDARAINEDTSVTIDVLGNDDDPNGELLTLYDVSDPRYGHVTIDVSSLIYSPTQNFHGVETLTYTVHDPIDQGDVGHVTITVRPVNDAPAIGWRTVLYNGALKTGTPDTQGFTYHYLPPVGASATQTFSGSTTILDTTPNISDQAGYFVDMPLTLDRSRGYTVRFTAQVLAETHNTDHRAGFSVIVLSQDRRGIELGFWENAIWAQEGGEATSALFTRAENATFDTTQGLVAYELTVRGGMYTLAADTVILSGTLRDYMAFAGFPDPYETPNFLFLGDDTSSARAKIRLGAVSVVTNTVLPPYAAEANAETPIDGLGVLDQDAWDKPVVLTLTVGHGALKMSDGVSGTLIVSRPNPLVMRSTVGAINTALLFTPGLTYRSHAGFHGMDTLTVTLNDQGHTGSGGAQQAQRTMPLSVTDTLPPTSPVLHSPRDGAMLPVYTPTLVWRASQGASGYWLDFNGAVSDTGASTTYTTPVLNDGTYTWTVAAYDSAGNTSPYTDTWTFSVDTTPPAPPALISPADGDTLAETPVQLTWHNSPSPDVAGYRLDLNGVIRNTGASTTYTTPVLNDGTYTWTVAAYDHVSHTSVYTDTWTFSVAQSQPPSIHVYLPLVLRE